MIRLYERHLKISNTDNKLPLLSLPCRPFLLQFFVLFRLLNPLPLFKGLWGRKRLEDTCELGDSGC
jgi:hypothetical protein